LFSIKIISEWRDTSPTMALLTAYFKNTRVLMLFWLPLYLALFFRRFSFSSNGNSQCLAPLESHICWSRDLIASEPNFMASTLSLRFMLFWLLYVLCRIYFRTSYYVFFVYLWVVRQIFIFRNINSGRFLLIFNLPQGLVVANRWVSQECNPHGWQGTKIGLNVFTHVPVICFSRATRMKRYHSNAIFHFFLTFYSVACTSSLDWLSGG
jgi:hypothetical protein